MRGFYFTTGHGIRYFYNDLDGSVVWMSDNTGNKEARKQLPQRSPLGQSSLPEPGVLNKTIRPSDVFTFLKSEGYKQLVLVVTQDCNLRCHYCAYSGNYSNMRTHKPLSMSLDIAQAALRCYFEGFARVKDLNPYRIPVISFYGGEPLLNYELIEQIVELAKKLYPSEILFNLTTNGTIMPAKALDFFVENDFALTISINGPRSEHDRLRVFPNERGSFDRVFENLQKIHERHPKFYKERCTVLACYDTGTNLPAMAEFFDSKVNVLPPIGRVSRISPYFTDWYSRYSSQQKAKFDRSFEILKEKFFSQVINHQKLSPFLNILVGTPFRMIMMRRRNPSSRPLFLPYTGACIPGMKIAVDPQGRMHCCEKVNEQFPIGDIQHGLSIEKITTLMDSYRRQIYPECFDCPITKLCSVCYAIVAGNGRFEKSPSNLCLKIRESVKRKFEDLWALFEAGVKESDILHSEGGVP